MNREYILYGKKLLNQDPKNVLAFNKSVQLRVDEAVKRMNLPSDRIISTCISSMEKESFFVKDRNDLLIYMDKHQMDMLYMLALLYEMYGKVGMRYELYMQIYQRYPYFEKKLSFFLLVLQAEKCLNRGDTAEAKKFLDLADSQGVESEVLDLLKDYGEDYDWVFSLLFPMENRRDVQAAFYLNFFVFHECAHAKYTIQQEELKEFVRVVEEGTRSLERVSDLLFADCELKKPSIPLEEYVCDTYALYILFDYIFEQSGDYEIERMLESYFVSIVNAALVHSDPGGCELLSADEYIHACVRAIRGIDALLRLWRKENRLKSLIDEVMKTQIYIFSRYKQLKKHMENQWMKLLEEHGHPTNEILSYDDERALVSQLVERFSLIT